MIRNGILSGKTRFISFQFILERGIPDLFIFLFNDTGLFIRYLSIWWATQGEDLSHVHSE